MPEVRIPRNWKFGSIPQEILESDLSIYAKMLVGCILFHAWFSNKCWPGKKRLSKLGSMSERKVFDATKELEGSTPPLLRVERVNGKPNVYEFLSSDTQAPRAGVEDEPRHTAPDTQAPRAGVPRRHAPTNYTHKQDQRTIKSPNGGGVSEITTFTQSWVKAFTEFFFGAKYPHRGPADDRGGKAIIAHCKMMNPPVDPMDFVLFAWRHARQKKFGKSEFVYRSLKTMAGFSMVMTDVSVAWSKEHNGASGPGSSDGERIEA